LTVEQFAILLTLPVTSSYILRQSWLRLIGRRRAANLLPAAPDTPAVLSHERRIQSMKSLALPLIMLLCLSLGSPTCAAVAGDDWASVRSPHFLLVGNAGEQEIRQVAMWLELFHDAFSRSLAKPRVDSPVPTTVIVFKNDSVYRPFKPLYQGRPADVAGYFQPGPDVNYITFSSESGGRGQFATAFHEYVHLHIKDNVPEAPLWLNEGLAEYYSTFSISQGEVAFGAPITHYLRLLRESEWLPLQTLVAVDQGSPHYNERQKSGVFYAESWALTHYLMLSDNGRRRPQLARLLNLLSAGVTPEVSFRQAFQADYATVEREVREYIGRTDLPIQRSSSDSRLESYADLRSAPVSDAEAQFYLGGLLAHIDRPRDAEADLQQAVALDPNLSRAHAALGLLRVRQGRLAEAKRHLQQAAADSQSHLVHYYYAYCLSREGMGGDDSVKGYSPGQAQLIRAELRKAISLAPDFAESYYLLGFINLVTGEELEQAVALLKRAQSLAPRREEFAFVLAQVYVKQQDFNEASRILSRLARSADSQVRTQAQTLLDRIAPLAGRSPGSTTSTAAAQMYVVETPAGDSPARETPPEPVDGGRVRGLLLGIRCTNRGDLLFVKVNERTLKLYTPAFERVKFTTTTPKAIGSVTCGQRKTANAVLVTYRPAKVAGTTVDGEVFAVTFVP
jgi:tetratricopeptide (TPR) repeat protein